MSLWRKNIMKEGLTALGIGGINTLCAAITYQGIITSFTLIANAVVALISLGFGAYKVIRVVIKHFKEKHGKDCDCDKEIQDIVNHQDK